MRVTKHTQIRKLAACTLAFMLLQRHTQAVIGQAGSTHAVHCVSLALSREISTLHKQPLRTQLAQLNTSHNTTTTAHTSRPYVWPLCLR